MGRKLKSMTALVVVMIMLYCQQAVFADLAYAKEKDVLSEEVNEDYIEYEDDVDDNAGEDVGEEGEASKEDGGDEMTPGEEEEEPKEDEGEEKPEEGEEPKEILCFESIIPKENGENGYYVTKPEIEICHISERGVTKYSFTDGDGQIIEGELRHPGENIRIESERFQEGTNHLSVWMEDEEGRRIEDHTLEKEFKVDTIAPVIRIQTPRGTDAWYQKEVFISVAGEDGDKGSQAEWISCYSEHQIFGNSNQPDAGFRITGLSAKGNAVPVTVRIKDRAGNYAQKTVGLYIDHQPPKTSIKGVENYMITSQPVEVEYRVDEDNGIGQASTNTEWEDTQGKVAVMKAEEWKETEEGVCSRQLLEEDGIYRLKVEAKDLSGYEDSSNAQVIIDKENPVIGYVDRIDRKYLQSFCWDYPVEEWIRDFTSYTYAITLDGKPYHMGEKVLREGNHMLEIKAVDSAGNTGTAKARFVIDHTPPQVVYQGLEEGATYEEKREFQITLNDQEDFIEEIRINGKLQDTASKSKMYQYSVQDCKAYEISVKAYDKAGNKTTSRMHFQVTAKDGILKRIVKPVIKKLGGSSEAAKEEEPLQRIDEKRIGGRIIIVFGIALIIGILGSGGIIFWKWKKNRESGA